MVLQLIKTDLCELLFHSEKAMAPHSSTLAWEIPWMEEPGRLQSMGSLRVGHDWATSLSLFPFMHWRRKWQPTPVFLPGESQGRGAWWAAVYGVTEWTRLKRLSSSSSSNCSTSVETVLIPSWLKNIYILLLHNLITNKYNEKHKCLSCTFLL